MKRIASLLVAGFLLAAPSAHATVVYLITSDHATGGLGPPPFGTVTVNQVGANVDVLVHLIPGYSFVMTGAADNQNFKFNGVGVSLADIVVDPHTPVLVAATGAFNGDGTGNFQFGI